MRELAGLLPTADVQLFYQTALMGRRDLDLAPDPRSGAEMTLLRMLAFRPGVVEKNTVVGGGQSGSLPAPKKAPPARAGTKPKTAVKAARVDRSDRAAKTATATESGQDAEWSELVTRLGLTGAERLLASNCAYLRRENKTIFLGLDARSDSLRRNSVRTLWRRNCPSIMANILTLTSQ